MSQDWTRGEEEMITEGVGKFRKRKRKSKQDLKRKIMKVRYFIGYFSYDKTRSYTSVNKEAEMRVVYNRVYIIEM